MVRGPEVKVGCESGFGDCRSLVAAGLLSSGCNAGDARVHGTFSLVLPCIVIDLERRRTTRQDGEGRQQEARRGEDQ